MRKAICGTPGHHDTPRNGCNYANDRSFHDLCRSLLWSSHLPRRRPTFLLSLFPDSWRSNRCETACLQSTGMGGYRWQFLIIFPPFYVLSHVVVPPGVLWGCFLEETFLLFFFIRLHMLYSAGWHCQIQSITWASTRISAPSPVL